LFKIKNYKLKILLWVTVGFFYFSILLIFPKLSIAESQYVLPYPAAMPGSVWYKIDLLKEKAYQFLYFGDFSQFAYNLAEADKYLVEAKTLFEYKQYLLGYQALLKSDSFFKKIKPNLVAAQKHGKNISEKESILKNAAQKHIETLTGIKNSVPESFLWTPEKDSPTELNLDKAIINSIKIRQSVL